MALNSQALSSLLQANLQPVINIKNPAQLKSVCDAIAQAVVQHVLTAVVVGSVTSGQGAPGAVTGTLT